MRSNANRRKPNTTRSHASFSKAELFYAEGLKVLKTMKVPFLVGGTYAVNAYTGIGRHTKDLDVFCRAGDNIKILERFAKKGYATVVTDERWLAKVKQERHYFDIIYGSANAISPVNDEWFRESKSAGILGVEVQLLPPTELLWSKMFVQDRYKYDGSDIAHVLLIKHADVDWNKLMSYMEQYWEVLLVQLLNFRFIYPSEREKIPRWVLDQLLTRMGKQIELPTTRKRVCRGRLYSRSDYHVDITQWGFADIIG
jgi:hypothetical protein